MAGLPLRFVHAADLHLERPAGGLSEIPQHLRGALVDAPPAAAACVFDTVLAEEADFLLLSGDVVDPQQAGPRELKFLVDQFERLAARQIGVYWAGGSVDYPERWPAALRLPDTVRRFPRGRAAQRIHYRRDEPLACVVGMSRHDWQPIHPDDFPPDPTGLFTVALAHGQGDAAALERSRVGYWALGGRHERQTLLAVPHMAHDPGTPLGRRPDETGVHGCTVVHVDDQGRCRSGFVPTDSLRWHREMLLLDDATDPQQLEEEMRRRIAALRAESGERTLLVTWQAHGSGEVAQRLRRGQLRAELLDRLRDEFGYSQPAAWSVALEVEPLAVLPAAWYEQETILGDYLRAIRRLEEHEGPIDLAAQLGARESGELAATAMPDDPAERRRVLREAAQLGADLLGGELETHAAGPSGQATLRWNAKA
jgi:DNA repair protein SbcD/Mre11